MRKPDVTFKVIVNPVSRVYSCAEKRAQEARGLIGFHLYHSCPNCRVVPSGFELWGENGHCQGSAADPKGLAYLLRYHARRQWRTQAGETMGYRFVRGGRIYYQGGEGPKVWRES